MSPTLAVLAGLDTADPADEGSLRTLLTSTSPLTLALPPAPAARTLRLAVALVWACAILLDASSTWVALQGPFREANPVVAALMSWVGVEVVILAASVLCCALALLCWSRGGPPVLRGVRAALGCVAGVKLAAALHNLALLS